MSKQPEQFTINQIQGVLKISEWIAFRFLHIRILLNWSWEPDRYDFMPWSYQMGIYKDKKELVGGARLIFPTKKTNEMMLFGENQFKQILNDANHLEKLICENMNFFVEATRLLISYKYLPIKQSRNEILRMIMVGIYQATQINNRPIVLAIVQHTLYEKFLELGLPIKLLGKSFFSPRNKLERTRFGKEVPHYALAIYLPHPQYLSDFARNYIPTNFLHILEEYHGNCDHNLADKIWNDL